MSNTHSTVFCEHCGKRCAPPTNDAASFCCSVCGKPNAPLFARGESDAQRAWTLYVALVGASLLVDIDNNGRPSLGQQPAYIELAELAFKAARAFDIQRHIERNSSDKPPG